MKSEKLMCGLRRGKNSGKLKVKSEKLKLGLHCGKKLNTVAQRHSKFSIFNFQFSLPKIVFPQVLLVLCFFLLAGCAGLVHHTTEANHYLSWQARQAELNRLQNWQMTLAFSVSCQNETNIAHATWQQQDDAYDILIESPLDLVSARLTGDAHEVTFQKGRTQKVVARDLSHLMQQELGWSAPIQNLIYWMRGLSAPGTKATLQFDAYNHLIDIKQDGWQVALSDFSATDNIDLPTKLLISSPKMHIKIVVKSWAHQNSSD